MKRAYRRTTILIRLLILLLTLSGLSASLGAAHASPNLVSGFSVTPSRQRGTSLHAGSLCDLATAVSRRARASTPHVAAGTYTGTGSEVVRLEYSVNLLGGLDGAASGVVLRDPQVHVSVLDGQDARRVIFVDRNRPLIDGFTITRGNSTQNGGGIYVNDGLPTIRHNILSANYGTSYGSAMYVAKGGANVR